MQSEFTTEQAAKILGQTIGVLKMWRLRDLCRYGGNGSRLAYSWIEILKMGAALSLNGMGVNLSRAFKMVEDRHAHQLFASIVVGEKWPDRALFAVFDPERQGEFRQSVIARFDTSPAAMFSSPVDHDIPSEGYLIVNLSAIGRRRLKDIENFVSAGGDK